MLLHLLYDYLVCYSYVVDHSGLGKEHYDGLSMVDHPFANLAMYVTSKLL